MTVVIKCPMLNLNELHKTHLKSLNFWQHYFHTLFSVPKNTPHLCSRTSASLDVKPLPQASEGLVRECKSSVDCYWVGEHSKVYQSIYSIYIWHLYIHINILYICVYINVISLYINILNSISQGGWWMVDSFSSTSQGDAVR